MTNHNLSNIKPQFFTVLFMSLGFSMSTLAGNQNMEVATQMAYALVAHECGKDRTPKMTAGYESGVYMSMNKMNLSKAAVTQILMQQKTLALTDSLTTTLSQDVNSGKTSCGKIYKYVVNSLMPRLDNVSQQ